MDIIEYNYFEELNGKRIRLKDENFQLFHIRAHRYQESNFERRVLGERAEYAVKIQDTLYYTTNGVINLLKEAYNKQVETINSIQYKSKEEDLGAISNRMPSREKQLVIYDISDYQIFIENNIAIQNKRNYALKDKNTSEYYYVKESMFHKITEIYNAD